MTDRELAVAMLADRLDKSPRPEWLTLGQARLEAEDLLKALREHQACAIARALPGTMDHAWATVSWILPAHTPVALHMLALESWAGVDAGDISVSASSPARALYSLAEKWKDRR